MTLLGTVDDWIQLREKIDKLKDFDIDNLMTDWHGLLVKVLDKLVESAKGEDCTEFWDLIMSNIEGGGSGPGPFISGWAGVFCIFNGKGEWVGNKESGEWNDWPIIEEADIA